MSHLGPDSGSLFRFVGILALPWSLILLLPLQFHWPALGSAETALYLLVAVLYPVLAAMVLANWNSGLARAARMTVGESCWLFSRAVFTPAASCSETDPQRQWRAGWVTVRYDQVEVWTAFPAELRYAFPRHQVSVAVPIRETHELVQECALRLELAAGDVLEFSLVRAGILDLVGVGKGYASSVAAQLSATTPRLQ